MVIPVALAAMLERCAPNVGPITMSAVVRYESGDNPNAIGDNTAHRSYHPASQFEAIQLASSLIAHGHNVDMGLAQVNSTNLPGYGLSVAQVFDPCTNLNTGSRILAGAYQRAAAVYGPGQVALFHALEAYNTGKLNGRPSYARTVLQIAMSGSALPSVVPPLSLPSVPAQRVSQVGAAQSIAVRNTTESVMVWRPSATPTPLPLTATNVFNHPGAQTAPLAIPVTSHRSKPKGMVQQ